MNDELEALKSRQAVLENRVDTHDTILGQHASAISKLNEAITVVRESLARVATKDDILALTRIINEQHTQELRDAHNGVPAKVMMVMSIVMGVLGLAGFALAHFHG